MKRTRTDSEKEIVFHFHLVQLSAINFGTQMGKAEQSRKGRLSEICLGRAAAHKAVFDLKRMGGGMSGRRKRDWERPKRDRHRSK